MAGKPKRRQAEEYTDDLLHYEEKTDAAFNRIFDLIATGYDAKSGVGKYISVNQKTNFAMICQELGLSYRLMWNYLEKTPEVKQQFEDAKKARADRLVEEILDIADEPSETMVEAVDKKTRIDARKYVAKVHYRDVYGDKVEVTNMNIDLVSIHNEAMKRLEKAIEGERIVSEQ